LYYVGINNDLIDIIRSYIEDSPVKAIPFRDYMDYCLYHPTYGYYMKDKEKIGRSGDFYTSASIGGLFGEVLAHYTAEQAGLLRPERPFTFVEWGGGTGQLARQMLDELKLNRTDVYNRLTYISVEASPHHRALQAAALAGHAERVQWRTERQWLAEGPWEDVIVFSNELIDAFPVHRLRMVRGQLCEIYVGWDVNNGNFRETDVPLNGGPLADDIRHGSVELSEGQQLEVNLEGAAWIGRIGAAIRSGQLVTVDYGDSEGELYAPHRMNGTLMCYRNHTANDNPYADPGYQDITSHVNFSRLIRAGEGSGLRTEQFVTQKQFLVENGLLQKLRDTTAIDPFSPEARRNRAVRQLLLSDQMSELFKVLVQKKGELH